MTCGNSEPMGRRVLAAALAAGLLLAALTPAWASGPEDRRRQVEQRLDDAQAELNQSTKALDDATKAYADAEAALPAAQAALADAEAALVAAQAALVQAQAELAAAKAADARAAEELAAAEERVREQEARIAEITAEIEGKRAQMSRVAVQAYQQGSLGQLANLTSVLGATDLADFTSRVSYAQSVLNADDSILTGMRSDRANLANERVRLEELREHARLLREEAARKLERTRELEAAARVAADTAQQREAEARAAKESVDSLIDRRSTARAAADQAKQDDATAYAELEAERDKIDAEIRELARKAREEAERKAREEADRKAREQASRGSGGGGIGDGGGGGSSSSGATAESALRYPVANPFITSSYGMRTHPITGVYKLHDGTDFRAYCGTPIRAAATGRVEWAHYRSGYGNQVLVVHGSVGGTPLMSSYSHLSRFAVSPGSRVSRGRVIGYSGTTGYSTACHLHFMVYADGVRTNPMSYL